MSALLNGLLVGAGRMMDSVGSWADHLLDESPSELASRFIEQLDDEWPDTLPPDPFCEQVTEQARRRVSAWHAGWPHLWGHILRVTGAAVALAEDEGIDPAPAYLMGMCHDVAKLDEERTGDTHEEMGAAFAGRVLRGHLAPDTIEAIQDAILKEGDDPLAHILNDADKLDKIGAAGVLRRVSTQTFSAWVPDALWRVRDDAEHFPTMHFEHSRALARSKQHFLDWFLPLAEAASDDWALDDDF
jgi:HD superfamily phosphodiesterase